MSPSDAIDEFDRLYDRWFRDVMRWLRALGAPEAEVEDWAQEVFIVVRRKMSGFNGDNPAGWLYGIASRTASDQRRRAWFRRLVLRRRDSALEEIADPTANAIELLQQREAQLFVRRLLAQMSEKRRVTFALFEIEGCSGEEIAALLGMRLATVWTTLHFARKEFVALVEKHVRKESR